MKKIFYSSILVLLLLAILFFNVGRYTDVTQKSVKSDLIVCLGGGTPERIQKAITLYNEGYSTQNLLLLSGEPYANKNYILKHHPETRYVLNTNAKNTADEIRFVKKYMAKHHYWSAIIVTDPPHSRRIKVLTNLISVKNDEEFSYVFVGSDVAWWHRNKYYQNRKAFRFARNEILRIPYTYLYYGLLEKIGFKWSDSEYKVLKKKFGEFVN